MDSDSNVDFFRQHLFEVLYYLKTYPTARHLKVLFQAGSGSHLLSSITKRTAFLATKLTPIMQAKWSERMQVNPLAKLFGNGCVGIVDTFPVRVRRPKDSSWQSAMYNGKYGTHVVKFQIIVDHFGVPMYVTGPHIGVDSDVSIWRTYGPVLNVGESMLADKAYVGTSDTIVPYKEPINGSMTELERLFNKAHGWFRVTVEHSIAEVKSYSICSSRFRGPLCTSQSFLRDAIVVVSVLSIMRHQTSQS